MVTETGHWRIDGLPTFLPSDPARVFAVDPRGGFTVHFEGPVTGGAPRVVHARLHADVSLGSAAELELPDPIGACAPVALTARSPGELELELEGARVELHLLRLPNGEEGASKVVRHPVGRLGSRRQVISAASRLVAEGRATATGRIVAPDLPLGLYELRVPDRIAVEDRLHALPAEPSVDVVGIDAFDVTARICLAWGRFEHAGQPVETALTGGSPEDDD